MTHPLSTKVPLNLRCCSICRTSEATNRSRWTLIANRLNGVKQHHSMCLLNVTTSYECGVVEIMGCGTSLRHRSHDMILGLGWRIGSFFFILTHQSSGYRTRVRLLVYRYWFSVRPHFTAAVRFLARSKVRSNSIGVANACRLCGVCRGQPHACLSIKQDQSSAFHGKC